MGPLAKSWRSNWPVLEQNGALAWALQPTEYPLHYSNLVPNEFDLLLPARCFDWALGLSYLKRKLKACAIRDTHILPQDFTLSLGSKRHICFTTLCSYTHWCFALLCVDISDSHGNWREPVSGLINYNSVNLTLPKANKQTPNALFVQLETH